MAVKLPNAFKLAEIVNRKLREEENGVFDEILVKFSREVGKTTKKTNVISFTIKDRETVSFDSHFKQLLKNHITDAGYVDVHIDTNSAMHPISPIVPVGNIYHIMTKNKTTPVKFGRSLLYAGSVILPMVDLMFAPVDIQERYKHGKNKKLYNQQLKEYEENNVIITITYS